MELIIDLHRCDLDDKGCSLNGLDAATLADAESARNGRSLTLPLPRSATNEAILCRASDPHATPLFNSQIHRATLSAGGVVLLDGTVRLLAVENERYTVQIREGGANWAEQAALRSLDALAIDCGMSLTPTAICASWEGTSPLRFFPIHRDDYTQQNSSTDLLPAERLLSIDDYHPFLHIATLVEQIFAEAGYTVESQFLRSEFFRSLYLSGAYASHDTTAITARMGFTARRQSSVTATADYAGRVAANPKTTYHTVGNLVETATAQSIDTDGEAIDGLYNNGNCFTLIDGKIAFVPTTQVSVGFEYALRYTTDHRIRSRTRLTGFDTLYLGAGERMSFTLANRYTDRRAEIAPDHAYRVLVFDHTDGAQYRLTYTLNGVSETLWSTFSTRSALLSTPAGATVDVPRLQLRNGSAWSDYTGDWALYDGYVGETGQTTVEVRLRTAAEICSPDSPKYFNLIFFEGAEEGMSLTLDKRCALRPRFLSSPGFGSWVEFADVAHLSIRQSELLEALQHLFNLRFFTEERAKKVYIEPFDDFYSGTPVDWSDRTDFTYPVRRTPIAPTLHERRTWCYLAGDGAVARFDAEADAPLGSWTATTDSCATLQGEQTLRNPLFRSTLNSLGHYLNAPSARLLQVGDRDAAEQDGTNFSPRIVCYKGLHALPEGERWGYPANAATYPFAAFHFGGDSQTEAFTLAFEDRDGAEGLHRFYDRQVAQEALRERITLHLRLTPDQYAALFAPGCGAADIRSRFRIDTGNGVVCATLQSIGSYDPQATSIECTFTRTTEDQ